MFTLLFIPIAVHANVIWPALIAERKITSLPIIALSLLIEYFFFKYLFQIDKKLSISYTLAANAVSTLLGAVLRPFSGILWEVSLGFVVNRIFNWGTFNPIAYLSVPILGGAVNALLELLIIRIIWKQKLTGRNYLLTWGINALTIAIAGVYYRLAACFLI